MITRATMDEMEWIRDAQQGDLEAFNRLVVAHQSRVFNTALRIMGDEDSASDATQEAFISAFRNIRRYRGGSFQSWLLRIVTNSCYDELRRRKRRPATSIDDLMTDAEADQPEAGLALASRLEGPEAATERSELNRAIADCLRRLPDEFRVVAVLADVQGFEYAEVAKIVGTPLGTVKSRLARARVRLRDCLQVHGELLPAAFRLQDETV
jgi:RNA polymerase sigma-70 factor (ECF subfamily)